MIKACDECGKDVSSDADSCPHCGYRLRGREHMVNCAHCGNDIIPIANPHDTISKYCPICGKPATNQGCRYAFFTVSILFALTALAIFLGFAWLLSKLFH
ncbi:MAG: zinc ribbon domain-containing protein [Verrucomicrobiales bacterium]